MGDAKHFGDRIVEDFMCAGSSVEADVLPKDVDQKQLEEGIHVEMEHTTDPVISLKISLDHLAEHQGYYTALSLMEQILERGHLRTFKAFAKELGLSSRLRKVKPHLRKRLGLK